MKELANTESENNKSMTTTKMKKDKKQISQHKQK